MGRTPLSSKEGLTKGSWTTTEDKILSEYIKIHGEGKWRNISKQTGLKRNGKSCRLRWLNYLRPDIKRGNISPEEEDLILRLHKLLGNRWSLIAGRLPGRTDNEIKNYWNTTLSKKMKDNNCKKANVVQSSEDESKLSSPLTQLRHHGQKKGSCRRINDTAVAAAQDHMDPTKAPTLSFNTIEDEDEDEDDDDDLGSFSPMLSERIPLDNFTWDFEFDEFLLSDLCHFEFSKI